MAGSLRGPPALSRRRWIRSRLDRCSDTEPQEPGGTMATLTASIFGGILCGIIMVLGGILLLYKGAIQLESASKDPALTVDVFNKQFSLSTRVPALGLFVIGLLFVGSSMWVAMKTDVPRISVTGELAGI